MTHEKIQMTLYRDGNTIMSFNRNWADRHREGFLSLSLPYLDWEYAAQILPELIFMRATNLKFSYMMETLPPEKLIQFLFLRCLFWGWNSVNASRETLAIYNFLGGRSLWGKGCSSTRTG